MVDWIHCNGCYQQPGTGQKFSLTNCGHIFCQDCLRPGESERCRMCNEIFKLTPLTSQMSPEVSQYFTEPCELLQKHIKQLTQIYQVMDFQRNHRRNLSMQIHQKLGSMNAKVSEAIAAIDKMKVMMMEIQRLQKELTNAEKENNYLKDVIKSFSERKSPYSLIRAHGEVSSIGLNSGFPSLQNGNASDGAVSNLDQASRGSSESHEKFTLNLPNKSSSTQNVPALFNFRTPTSNNISPWLSRLSVRNPPSNGRLGEIAHVPTSSRGTTPTQPIIVRDHPGPVESRGELSNRTEETQSRTTPVQDRLLTRLLKNYPDLKL